MMEMLNLKCPDTNYKVLALPQELESLCGALQSAFGFLSANCWSAQQAASGMRRWWGVKVAGLL